MAYAPFDLGGRGVVVTGGNGGIGYGMARALLAAGARVAIWGSNPEKTRKAHETLAAECGDVAFHFTDGVFVDFDKGDVVAADGEADGADTGVEVEDMLRTTLPTHSLRSTLFSASATGTSVERSAGIDIDRFHSLLRKVWVREAL